MKLIAALTVGHQVNSHLHQGDQDLTSFFWVKNSDQNEYVLCQTYKCYLKQGGNSCWAEMSKCRQNLLIFKISPRALVSLVGRLFFRPGSLKRPTKWGFARAVIQGWNLL